MRKGFLILALLAPFAAACGVAPRPVLSPERPAFASAVPRVAIPAAVELAPLAARPLSGLLELGDLALQPANTLVTFNCASVVGVAPMSVALPLTADASARITGCGFGGSQGTVEICNASSYGGTCVAATVTSWAATDITATINEGSFTDETAVWLYVTTAGSVVNRYGLGPLLLQVSSGCSLADGHNHTTMAAADCFPELDGSNVGVPAGTSLTSHGGGSITTPTTIDSREITNCLNFSSGAVGTLIKKSYIHCSATYMLNLDDQSVYSATNGGTTPLITIEDSLIDGEGDSTNCLGEGHFVIRRSIIMGCENLIDANQNVLVEDSLLFKVWEVDENAHGDAIQCAPGRWNGSTFIPACKNITLRHNTILGRSYPSNSANVTSAFIMNKNGDISVNILVELNRLGGGSFTIYCNRGDDGNPDYAGDNIRVINNYFWSGVYPPAGDESDDCANEADASGNVLYPAGTPLVLN